MKIDALGIRVTELEVSNSDPDLVFLISARQMAFLLRALQSAQSGKTAPNPATPLSWWLEGFEAGPRLERSMSLQNGFWVRDLADAVPRFPRLSPQRSEQPDRHVSANPDQSPVRSKEMQSPNDVSLSSSASSCVEADKVGDAGDGVMSSPDTIATSGMHNPETTHERGAA